MRRKIFAMGETHSQDEDARPHMADRDEEALSELKATARSTKPVSGGEQERLLHQAGLGDKDSQDRLVAANLDLVVRIAESRGEQRLSLTDLVQEGSIGLVEAVRSFAKSGEVDFVKFAELRVAAQMDAAIEAEAAAVREEELLIAAATDYERALLVSRHELRRPPTEAELAEKLEWTVERTRYVAQVVAEARRRHDEEMLAFIDPADIDFDADERPGLDS